MRRYTAPLVQALYALLLLAASPIALGGGIKINPDTLLFDDRPDSRTFAPSSVVSLSARGEDYTYSGKPYKYAVFVLYRVSPGNEMKLMGRFLGQIITKPMFKIDTRFALPQDSTKYELHYHTTPFFSYVPMEEGMYGGFLKGKEAEAVELYFRDPANSPHTEPLAKLEAGAAPPKPEVFLYLSGFQKIQDEIEKRKPPTFKWYIGSESSPKARDIRFTYRLSPLEEEWSIPARSKEVTYHYLPPGNYTFEVRALFRIDDKEESSGVAQYGFTVKRHIYSIAKGDAPKTAVAAISPEFAKQLRAQKSRALLIGVPQYDAGSGFSQLPFVRSDTIMLAKALAERGFETTVLTPDKEVAAKIKQMDTLGKAITVQIAEPTKSVIEHWLAELRKSSSPGDRVILYFSGHGTAEGGLGYIVPKDCRRDNRQATCISLEYLKDWMNKMMTVRDVQHLLIVLDSCQSGLGVLSKGSSDVDVATLSRHSSAHMMTAGLADQEAFADAEQQMSIFTSFLIKGLHEADYTKDGAITLSELTLYVQDSVSRYVFEKYQKEQTPVMGKVKGAGEMVFVVD